MRPRSKRNSVSARNDADDVQAIEKQKANDRRSSRIIRCIPAGVHQLAGLDAINQKELKTIVDALMRGPDDSTFSRKLTDHPRASAESF